MTQPGALSNPPADAHVAACGLFCTNCRSFKRGRCQGCQIEPGFARCAIRRCCQEKGITNCAQCQDFAAPRSFRECPRVNNLIGRILGAVFGSDRPGMLAVLRDEGLETYLELKRASGRS